MTNSCRGCTNAANDAWDLVTDFLLHPPETVERRGLEQNHDHDDAGWIIQTVLISGDDPEYDKQIVEFEESHPVEYPRHLKTIQKIIERRCRVIEPNTCGHAALSRYSRCTGSRTGRRWGLVISTRLK